MSESVLWEINNRTKAKHHIIKNYLKAWLPIMTRYNKRILYLDGFCGPGEYTRGEKGSPIIALETALNHTHKPVRQANISWIFVDENEDAIDHLKSIINGMNIYDNYNIIYRVSTFSQTIEEIFKLLEEQKANLAPSLILIDPFGFTGFTMQQVTDLMGNDKCEVIINFMYEHINRFLAHDDMPDNFDNLFGCEDWRAFIRIKDPEERNKKLVYLYHQQLQKYANIDFVRSFELRRGNRPSYYLFFGTNNIKGLEKMKDAMWKVDPTGNYTICDNYYGRQTLFQPEPDYNQLIHNIKNDLTGKVMKIEKLLDWVLVETAFRKAGIKNNVLKSMEKNGQLKVMRSSRKRNYSYPDGTIIKIL
ncbi:MAG: three-Cys-motif partner protein TcmP [Halanaerobiales bacterium]